MDGINFAEVAGRVAHDVLAWVGFGTLVGLLAKAIMPGRDQGGPLATLLMGVGGSVTGCAILSYLWAGYRVSPLSPVGFLAAVGGAFLLLFFHRLLSGTYFREGGSGVSVRAPPKHRRTVVRVEP